MELNLKEITYRFFDWITGTFHFMEHPGFEDNAHTVIDENNLWKSRRDIDKELNELKDNRNFTESLIELYASPGDNEIIYNDILSYPIIFKRIYIPEINGYEKSEYQCSHVFNDVIIDRNSEAYDYFFTLQISSADHEYMNRFLSYHLDKYFSNNLYDFAFFLLNLLKKHSYLWVKERHDKIKIDFDDWIDLKLKFSGKQNDNSGQSKDDELGDVTVSNKNDIEVIFKYLHPFFSNQNDKNNLKHLLNGSKVNCKLIYSRKGKELAMTFYHLNEQKIITVGKLSNWIVDNFKFTYGNKVMDFKFETIEDYFSKGREVPKKHQKLIQDLTKTTLPTTKK